MTPRDLTNWRLRHCKNKSAAARTLGTNREAIRLWESGRKAIPRYIELACKAIDLETREKAEFMSIMQGY